MKELRLLVGYGPADDLGLGHPVLKLALGNRRNAWTIELDFHRLGVHIYHTTLGSPISAARGFYLRRNNAL